MTSSGAAVLWVRCEPGRSILAAHLASVAGRFRAARWRVVVGADPPSPEGRAVAVLDDPWLEPLPAAGERLAVADGAGSAVWRAPRVLRLEGEQGWRPRHPPATWLEYERAAIRPGRPHVRSLSAEPWFGFLVAAAGEAEELFARGWPPRRGDVALVAGVRLFRHADPAGHERRELVPFVPVEARKVVDVGCGRGLLGALLRSPGRWVMGIEPEVELARAAAKVLDAVLPAPVEVALAAIRSPIDCFVLADVLEHTADPAAVLRGLVPLLSPGGTVVVSLPNAAWSPVVRALAAGRWDTTLAGVQARDHLFFTTPVSFTALARECGLRVRTMRLLPETRPLLLRLWSWFVARSAGGDPSALAAPQMIAVLERL